jgi:hypothetical protein
MNMILAMAVNPKVYSGNQSSTKRTATKQHNQEHETNMAKKTPTSDFSRYTGPIQAVMYDGLSLFYNTVRT